MRPALRLPALVVAGLLSFAACGSGGDTPAVTPAAQAASTTVVAASPTSTVATTSPPTTAAPAATTTTAAPNTTVASIAKVNANTASRAEMTAAITAAGVSNASRWAMEVEEYRPYPTTDPTFAKLRQNLVKYNPAPGVVDGIVSALSL